MIKLSRDVATRDFLEAFLNENLVLIEFYKMNGDLRLMLCTTSAEYVPMDMDDDLEGINNSGNTFTVYDLEKEGWRRFKYDRLASVYI